MSKGICRNDSIDEIMSAGIIAEIKRLLDEHEVI